MGVGRPVRFALGSGANSGVRQVVNSGDVKVEIWCGMKGPISFQLSRQLLGLFLFHLPGHSSGNQTPIPDEWGL